MGIYMIDFSDIIVLCRENNIHSGNGGSGDAAAYGHDSPADVVNANCDTKLDPIPTINRICHEYSATSDTQASLEAAQGVGGFCQVLRKDSTAEFRGGSSVTSCAAHRSAENGAKHAGAARRACGSFC